ncbi:MAG: hypothetical protein LBH72_07310 [Proteiniphilum sp.]|jgi:hypothetical protein|nr:hypothetical protein [Proteiniphilum sp.]
MRNIDGTDRSFRLLAGHYYGNILLLALLFLLTLLRLFPFPAADGQPGVSLTLERYAIMITIIAIPVSLKCFALRLRKLPRPQEAAAAAEKYGKSILLRLYTVSGVTLMHIILFGISRNMNFFWFTALLFTVFLFCKPARAELESLSAAPPPAEGSAKGESPLPGHGERPLPGKEDEA